MWDTPTSALPHLRLDLVTDQWVDTGVTIDTRSSSRADVLWTGSKLYVATHVSSTSPASGYPSRLLRFTYDAAARTYRLDAGFPVTINDDRSESLVIDRDGTGTLWATWVRAGRVWIARTLGSDTQWSAPFTPAVKGSTTLSSDDISSVIALRAGEGRRHVEQPARLGHVLRRPRGRRRGRCLGRQPHGYPGSQRG